MRDPSRIPTHHGVFHFRERQYACAHVRARTRAAKSRARSCVHLSTFVSIACEKRRGEKRPALQRVVQILSDRSRHVSGGSNDATVPFPFPLRALARARERSGLFRDSRTYRRDYSIAPAPYPSHAAIS